MARRPPEIFYPTVTPTKVEYPGAGATESVDLPLVTLPPGTLLFRGIKLPHHESQVKDRLRFFRDFLGDPQDNGTVCLDPTHNVFFYPYPYVPFGAHDVGSHFTAIAVYVLVHPTTVIANMTPSEWVRGFGNRYSGNAPFQRCSEFMKVKCKSSMSYIESKALEYDNCINPTYAKASGVRGWMALADLDSFEPKKFLKRGDTAKNAPMTQSMMRFAGKALDMPDQLSMMLAFAYRDAHNHAGYPEIALYPTKSHPGAEKITRACPNERAAARILQKEAGDNNLNFLPVAMITKSRITDFTTGLYNAASVKATDENYYASGSVGQLDTLRNAYEWMTRGFYEGYRLPFYGDGKIAVDSRTGFLVMPQMLPRNLTIPIPPAVRAGGPDRVPYTSLALAMDSPAAQKRAIQYALLFRNFLPSTFMKQYPREQTGLRRAFIFGRPAMLNEVAEKIGASLPPAYVSLLRQARGMYQKEAGVLPKPKVAAAAAAAGGLAPIRIPGAGGVGPVTPPYYAGATPPYANGIAPVPGEAVAGTPEYGGATPEFGGATPEFGEGEAAAGATPEFGEPLPKGGRRKTRSKAKGKRRKTRRATAESEIQLGRMFASIWRTHAKANA